MTSARARARARAAALGHMAAFDPATALWTPVPAPAGGAAPIGRIGPGLAASGTRLYLFGGFDGTGFVRLVA